ncbi:MAG: hypothetical protein R3B35_01955 [Gemmatimonadales bacterium]
MPQLRLLIFTSLCTGFGALLGALVGRPLGARTTMLTAMVAGTMALLTSLRLAATRGWMDPDRRKGGSIGGLVGLGLASPLAVMTLQRPAVLVVAVGLVGLGVLVGAGRGAAR